MRLKVKNALPIALLVGSGLMLLAPWGTANAAAATLRCNNPASGATWDVKIDYQSSTADSFPATITEENIKWRDVRGGHYEFDRASGNLIVIYASSMGGFSLNDKCHFIQ
jgi:hypothetical protein